MSIRNLRSRHFVRPTLISTCLAVALGSAISAHADAPLPGVHAMSRAQAHARMRFGHAPAPQKIGPPAIRSVTSCADDGSPGTLRIAIENAASGDTIDLTGLACSKITLDASNTPPDLDVVQDYLYIKGPGADALTIDGNHQTTVFEHFGNGKLTLHGVSVVNGYYESATVAAYGGCVYSTGSVVLDHSIVSHCHATSASTITPAIGGGVFAKHDLELASSEITDAHAFAQNGAATALGGGVYVKGNLNAIYSTVSGNTAFAIASSATGGGIATKGNVDIQSSTVVQNSSLLVGGIALQGGASYTANLRNSTVSNNTATSLYGGIWTSVPLTLLSSTVAFNSSGIGASDRADGVHTSAALTLGSSIIAGNAGPSAPNDLSGPPGTTVTATSKNVIMSGSLNPPFGTIEECPKLQPLANNGGTTRTRALRHDSPALDQGAQNGLLFDQRLGARVVNGQADIGSVERQAGEVDDMIFRDRFDPIRAGVCDQDASW